MGGRGGDTGVLMQLLLELNSACTTSHAWAFPYLQHGYVQQLTKYMDIEARSFLLKALNLFILPDYQRALRKPVMSQSCYSKYST